MKHDGYGGVFAEDSEAVCGRSAVVVVVEIVRMQAKRASNAPLQSVRQSRVSFVVVVQMGPLSMGLC